MKEFSVVVQVNLDLQVKVKSSSLEEAVEAVEFFLDNEHEVEYEDDFGSTSRMSYPLAKEASAVGEWMGGFVQESSGKPVAWEVV
tara:strand:+ start:745 stop:999 length:255 start_codon:yes stop_codon:yes gene_type:complete